MPTCRSVAAAILVPIVAVAVFPILNGVIDRLFDEGRVSARPFVQSGDCPENAGELLQSVGMCKAGDAEKAELAAKHLTDCFPEDVVVAAQIASICTDGLPRIALEILSSTDLSLVPLAKWTLAKAHWQVGAFDESFSISITLLDSIRSSMPATMAVQTLPKLAWELARFRRITEALRVIELADAAFRAAQPDRRAFVYVELARALCREIEGDPSGAEDILSAAREAAGAQNIPTAFAWHVIAKRTGDAHSDYSVDEQQNRWGLGDGGWGAPSSKTAFPPSRCDIDRRRNLTRAEFVSDYLIPGKPVVIDGLIDDWAARTEWTRTRLIERYGARSLPVRRSSTVSPALIKDQKDSSRTLSLRTYVQELLAPDETSFADLPYLFQRNLALSLGFEALGDLQPLHLSMFEPHGDQLAWPHGRREQMLQLFLGGTGSGVGFHHHGAAMNAILFGRKQWWLLPPYGHVIMDPELRPGAEGSTEKLGELPIAPLQCVQEAGEVMFVPTQWLHAVGNLAPTIGTAIELG